MKRDLKISEIFFRGFEDPLCSKRGRLPEEETAKRDNEKGGGDGSAEEQYSVDI